LIYGVGEHRRAEVVEPIKNLFKNSARLDVVDAVNWCAEVEGPTNSFGAIRLSYLKSLLADMRAAAFLPVYSDEGEKILFDWCDLGLAAFYRTVAHVRPELCTQTISADSEKGDQVPRYPHELRLLDYAGGGV
jgi:hypothetical protein